MITWATFPFLRYTPALILGIVACLVLGAGWPPAWPGALGLAGAAGALLLLAVRRPGPAATDAAGLLALLAVAALGAALAQRATESRRADHLTHVAAQTEAYEAVVDDYTVARPATYATTLRVRAVRVAGRWRTATGGIRVSVPRAGGVPAPRYGEVWLVRGHPDPSKAPLNPGEFDYRRYLAYHQVYHQQFIHPDQYRVVATRPPSYLVAISMRAAAQLDGVFKHYIKPKREYSMASALVLGIKDDVDAETKQAYAATGTTHIMAVSGLQVGLLFGFMTWFLRVSFGRTRGFRYWSVGVGLAVIWAYAFLTGLSPSVLRAAVMFSFVIVGRALERQDGIFNTLAVAAFCLLVYDPFLVADVGFQLSFLAVLSIVYLQPRIGRWFDAHAYFANRQRPWQPPVVQRAWRGAGWAADAVWQATALSLAAQVATFPLGLYYFHQFPLSFLLSNLVAVPISSGAVYVGLGLLVLKGLVALPALALPAAAPVLDYLPQAVAWVFERMILLFNEYIFWIGRALPGALVREIHVTAGQTVLVFGLLGAWLAWQHTRRLGWLGAGAGLAVALAGSRVAEARAGAPLEEFVVYSIPRRSVVGFWQGATAEFVAADSLPLSETERTYRLLPGLIQRGARAPACRVGWRGAAVPVRRLADADSANPKFYLKTSPVVLARWHGLRLGFVSGRLAPAARPTPLDVLVLRRNARVAPEALAAAFGPQVQVVFDSSCKSWYVARHDSALRALGLRPWDVTAQGAFRRRPPGR
ncbi:ComEC/Rec2 family competence protein [Hymenobacter caeli]|uniref:Competence protein ComEC n=1 Tax=Hymenobacter caeli TaxID=2735894 RepID=A0ABX2FSE7_9BACT|nr:ComEC/Rec2 family competence protein [Hymenobacter caeli]NRT20110.1 competence protein ComEC [Hymenobacter caeli]